MLTALNDVQSSEFSALELLVSTCNETPYLETWSFGSSLTLSHTYPKQSFFIADDQSTALDLSSRSSTPPTNSPGSSQSCSSSINGTPSSHSSSPPTNSPGSIQSSSSSINSTCPSSPSSSPSPPTNSPETSQSLSPPVIICGKRQTSKAEREDAASQRNDQLPNDFKVLPLRPVIAEKVERKMIDATVRKTIVGDNCQAVWQFSQYLTREERTKMARMIVTKYMFLKQPNNPPEVIIQTSSCFP